MIVSKQQIRRMAEVGFFKGKLREAYMRKSPIGTSIYTMPIQEAMSLFNPMDMAERPKLLSFLEGFTEEQIATNGWASLMYAKYVLKGRFRLGEPAIRGNWGNTTAGVDASVLFYDYKVFLMSLPRYNKYPGTAGQALTEEGEALLNEFRLMDTQRARE